MRSPTPIPPRWVRDVLAPHFDAEGRLCGWEGVVTDVTEQRALAVDLRRTTSMFHALVANLPAGVFFVQGPAGRPILVNNRARQLLGQREDAAAGSGPFRRRSIAFSAQTGRPIRSRNWAFIRRFATASPACATTSWSTGPTAGACRSSPGRRRFASAAPAQPDAAVWVLEDLTALHQAEAARRDTEGRLRTVVETMAEGAGRSGSQGRGRRLQRGRLRRLPPPAGTTARLPLLADGLGLPARGRRGPASRRTARADSAANGPADAELRPRLAKFDGGRRRVADSAVRWFLVNAMPLSGGAATAGVVTTFSDVTAHRRAQEILRISEEKYRGLVESLPLMVVQSDLADARGIRQPRRADH